MTLMALPGLFGALITVVVMVVNAFALADAAMRPTAAFPVADKQNKPFWLIILGLAMLAMVFLGGGLEIMSGNLQAGIGLVSIVGAVVSLVYLAGVRPAVREVGNRGRRSEGPYGPSW